MKEDVVSMSLQLCELNGTIDSLNDQGVRILTPCNDLMLS